ncbi:ribonuclease H-like domain-containing protein, partial [Tanacetum coccineum]
DSADASDAAAEFAMMGISPKVQNCPLVEKEVKPLYSTFVKAGEMHDVPHPITGTYMPSPYQSDIEETQVSYGSKSENKTSDTISESNDFVSCDNSDKSSDSKTHASCDSSLKTKTKDFPPAVDIKTLPKSDVEDPNSTTGSPSFSCLENVKSPRIFCNKSGMNNRNSLSLINLQPEQNVTCLIAKASLDESTRWHRRMAHVNFKTINKLAKEGLVDGLPLDRAGFTP